MQEDDLTILGQLEIELDEVRSLIRGEAERRHRVFRRVGRSAAVGDEPGLLGTRLAGSGAG